MSRKADIQNVIIAGGGTGGHIFPAIAIANAIKKAKPLTNFLFIGAKGKMEMQKVPQAGYNIIGIDIAGFNRSSMLKNIALPVKLVKSFLQVKSIFKSFQPDVVIGVGGYSSFPVLRYAQSKGIPNYVHESNSFAGKANIMLGKKATKIFTASAGMGRFFPEEKIMITGNPVRKNIIENNATKEEAVQFFGLEQWKITVLCVGGSLGAQSINAALANGLEQFAHNNLQLIWQTGEAFAEDAGKLAEGIKNVYVSNFIQHMEFAYTAADIIISRSGAMAVAEICLVRKPVLFVPYPFAAEDHQTVNAKQLVERNAALMIADKEVRESLVGEIVKLAKDQALQQQLKDNIAAFAVTDADERIAKEILFD